MTVQRPQAKAFRGLNNVTDPQQLGLAWQTQADNVDVTDRGQLVRCRGFAQSTTNFAITGAYATRDFSRLYVVDTGELRQMNADLSYTVLRTGLSAAKMYFTEVNGVVFYANGVDFGTIEPAGARPWGVPVPSTPALTAASGSLDPGTYQVVCTLVDDRGMESGSSDVAVIVVEDDGGVAISGIAQEDGYETNVYMTMANGTVFYQIGENVGSSLVWPGGAMGAELPFFSLTGPRGQIPAVFEGHMYVAEPFIELDHTVIWCSLPLHFHHFDLAADAVSVPGTVRMLRATEGALIIGTEREIYAYDGEKLARLADYGVVPGQHATELDDKLLFWTLRGLCRALPFENLTESTVSVPPGSSAGATVIEKDGMRRYVVALQTGGTAFNRRNT